MRLQDLLDNEAQVENVDHQENQDPKVIRGRLVQLVMLDKEDHLEKLDLQEELEDLEHLDLLDHLDNLDQEEKLDHLDLLVKLSLFL